MKKIIVIGAGASGLMAAAAAAGQGAEVTVLEKNEKAGKKIYITGKGRCNLTNDCDTVDFFDHVVTNPKFLYSAVYSFDHDAVKEFMERNGCRVKQERGMRVFPVTDHASDVTRALVNAVESAGGKILYHQTVKALTVEGGRVSGVLLQNGRKTAADAVIICTGGLSYASTGSTGDGYRFAKQAGHTVTETEPSLVSFHTAEKWPSDLAGLSLRNISVKVFPAPPKGTEGVTPSEKKKKNRPVYEGFGEMLFTHTGVSGPLVLGASARCSFAKHPDGFALFLDLKPAIPEAELIEKIRGMLLAAPDKQFIHAIGPLFPSRLTRTVTSLSGIDGGRAARTINENEIARFAGLLHAVPLTIVSGGGFEEAVITRGGVSVKEIDPSTMESKLVSGLYFAGEVMDVDAVTGGYNLQIAWSTGHLAGVSAAL